MTFDAALVTGYLLATVRAVTWVLVTPPFGGRTLPVRVRIGLAMALALVAGPVVAPHAPPLSAGPELVAAVALQALAGLALGLVTRFVFTAVTSAGQLVDFLGGFSASTLFDPAQGTPVTVFGRFYDVVAVTLLFAIDGHTLLVRGFLASFESAPLGLLDVEHTSQALLLSISGFLAAALQIALPVLAALVLTDVALGLVAKAAPQMHIFALGFTVKILVTLIIAGLGITVLPTAVAALLDRSLELGRALLAG